MGGLQKITVILGRILLSLIFLFSAVHKIIDWHGTEESLIQAMNHTLSAYTGGWVHDGINFLIPWASVLLVIALVFELVGSLFVIFGVKVRFGATLLILFLIPTTFFFHSFWTYQTDVELQMILFFKNLSILGGLLILLAFGKGGSEGHQHEMIDMDAPE